MYDFIYVCIYHMVPRKALLGRSQVAASLYAICLSLVFLTLLLWLNAYKSFLSNSKILLYFVIVVLVGTLVFNRVYFLKFAKQRSLIYEYSSWKLWKLKMVGILFLIFSFVFLMGSAIAITVLRR